MSVTVEELETRREIVQLTTEERQEFDAMMGQAFEHAEAPDNYRRQRGC